MDGTRDRALFLAAIAAVVLGAAAPNQALAATVDSGPRALSLDCTVTFPCQQTYDITTAGLLAVSYHSGSSQCGNVSVHYLVEGTEVGDSHTVSVTPGSDTTYYSMGPVSNGQHTLTVQPQGTCNGNSTTSFTGSVEILTSDTSAPQVWNAAWDFPRTATNPAPDSMGNQSVWTYGYGDPSSFTAMATSGWDATNDEFHGPYIGVGGYGYPLIGGDPNDQPLLKPSTLSRPEEIFVHPDGPPDGSSPATIAWTSPISGTVSVSGSVRDWDWNCGADGVGWSMSKGTTQLASGAVANADPTHGGQEYLAAGTGGSSLSAVTVNAGDVIYLSISAGQDYYCDSTGVSLSITQLGSSASGAVSQTLGVPATSNVFGAGLAIPPAAGGNSDACCWGGTPPPAVSFAAAAGRVLTVSSVSGSVNLGCGGPMDADGATACNDTDMNSMNGISGLVDHTTNHAGMLLGVFLSDSGQPATPPSRLDFSPTSSGGYGEDYQTIAPALGQTFYVGDGLTGDGSGSQQQIDVPADATRLYLGIADGYGSPCCTASHGDPGWYDDDTGSFTAAVNVTAGYAPPTITINTPPAGATYSQNQVVNADYSCSGQGVTSCIGADASGIVSNGQPIHTGTIGGPYDFTVAAEDAHGDILGSVVHHYSIAKPAITIGSPTDGATFMKGLPVKAQYSCSGAPTCMGTDDKGVVPVGGSIDTAKTGTSLAFNVYAEDSQANIINSATSHYNVLDPIMVPTDQAHFAEGSTVDAQFRCYDGVAKCLAVDDKGVVAEAGSIDTSKAGGPYDFTVLAEDAQNNILARGTHQYYVDAPSLPKTKSSPAAGTGNVFSGLNIGAVSRYSVSSETASIASAGTLQITSAVGMLGVSLMPAKVLNFTASYETVPEKCFLFACWADTSTVIAVGGGNEQNSSAGDSSCPNTCVIAVGGGNLFPASSADVIAVGGGNVVNVGSGNVIAVGGGNVIAVGGGNVLADADTDAGALVDHGSGKVIAVGGGNVIAVGGGNVIAVGGGNLLSGSAQGGVTVVKPGDVIAVGAGNIICVGSGNLEVPVTMKFAPNQLDRFVGVDAGSIQEAVSTGALIAPARDVAGAARRAGHRGRQLVLASAHAVFKTAGAHTIVLRFTPAGQRLIARLTKQNIKRRQAHKPLTSLRISLTDTLTPKHGKPVKATRVFTVTPGGGKSPFAR